MDVTRRTSQGNGCSFTRGLLPYYEHEARSLTTNDPSLRCFASVSRLVVSGRALPLAMDPALLREREAFRKKAYAQPAVESGQKRKEREPDADRSAKAKKPKTTGPSASSSGSRDIFSRTLASTSSGTNFSILTKIVKQMKERFRQGDRDALTLDELLDETNQLDIGLKQRQWLETEALRNNPKVEVTDEGKYAFLPALKNQKNRHTLIKLLDRYDREGKGGIPLDDIHESLPKADRILAQMANDIIIVTRPSDKKKVVFYNDKSMQIQVDEEFQKLWRSVAVDGIDEQKIEEYLTKQGIVSMQEMGGGKRTGVPIQKRKKTSSKKGRAFKKTNEHMGDILQDYSDQV